MPTTHAGALRQANAMMQQDLQGNMHEICPACRRRMGKHTMPNGKLLNKDPDYPDLCTLCVEVSPIVFIPPEKMIEAAKDPVEQAKIHRTGAYIIGEQVKDFLDEEAGREGLVMRRLLAAFRQA